MNEISASLQKLLCRKKSVMMTPTAMELMPRKWKGDMSPMCLPWYAGDTKNDHLWSVNKIFSIQSVHFLLGKKIWGPPFNCLNVSDLITVHTL